MFPLTRVPFWYRFFEPQHVKTAAQVGRQVHLRGRPPLRPRRRPALRPEDAPWAKPGPCAVPSSRQRGLCFLCWMLDLGLFVGCRTLCWMFFMCVSYLCCILPRDVRTESLFDPTFGCFPNQATKSSSLLAGQQISQPSYPVLGCRRGGTCTVQLQRSFVATIPWAILWLGAPWALVVQGFKHGSIQKPMAVLGV